MAWPKLKQYLENSWYRWASQDRQTGYAAQFQYGENINIRDMKNGVCLSGWSTDVATYSDEFSFFTYWTHSVVLLYTVDLKWDIRRGHNTSVICPTTNYVWFPPKWIQFWDDVYIIWDSWIYKCDLDNGTSTDVTPTWWNNFGMCVLNYANTYLIIWDANAVWRIDRLWVAKKIREFESSYIVFWLTQEWNYLKIYTSDWVNTKIHYAKGTFDVEDTWLVQTVSFNWLYLKRDWVTSDQWADYAAFLFASWELKLSKVSWYNKTDIRWTQTWDWQKIFTSLRPKITASDWVVFAATNEWIWTFTEYNGWLWWWCLEFKETNSIESIFRHWESLYACVYNWDDWYIMRYYDLSFHPKKYQSHGFIVGRVFDWWCAWLFKKNDQATITYNMPTDTSMELSYRYDRDTFWYDKSNFLTIKKLADTNTCYDIVVPTTPSNTDEYVLLKEDWDKILLENWNWIMLEDKLVCPFNKTWNLLEYRFDLDTTDTTKTPTLYEHSLTYYDYMRKYR